MPPSSTSQPSAGSSDTSHMLPPPHLSQGGILPGRKQESSMGPVVGAVIIILVLALGALYFWGAQLNKEKETDTLPLIPAQQG